MSATLQHPHLRLLLADAEAVRTAAEQLRDSLTPAQQVWRPAPNVWSVADCFEHLRKVDKAYVARIEEALQEAKAESAAYAPSWFGRVFIFLTSPQSRLRVRTMRAVNPAQADVPASAEALPRFLDQQAEVIRLLHAADGIDLNGTKLTSPLASVVRFSLGEALTMLVRHEQRHLGQAQRVTEHADFPAA